MINLKIHWAKDLNRYFTIEPSLVAQSESICPQCGTAGFNSWVGKFPWRRKWQLTSVFLPGESHRQRSLAGYSSWDRRVGHNLSLYFFLFLTKEDTLMANKNMERWSIT